MIRSLITFLALNILSVYLVHQLLDGFIITGGTTGFVVVGVVIGLLNVFVKPLLKVLSLPFIFLTIGLFLIIVNAAILWLAENFVTFLDIPNVTFMIEGMGTYAVAVLLLGILNYLFQKVLR